MAPNQSNTSPDVQHLSPLMSPVTYGGHPYFTSQYFHQQYLANSDTGGKYQRHTHFIRLLRSMESYQEYLSRGDIVELTWGDVNHGNTEVNQNRVYFQPLFQAAGYRPLTLLNGTAQIAMSHHLDDEISQQMSVATNARMAQQLTGNTATRPLENAHRDLVALLDIARLFNVPLHIAQQESVKMIEQSAGVDLRPLLIAAPAQDNIHPDERMLEPTELAREMGFSSPYEVNKFLALAGWQVRHLGGWEPTAAGQPFAARHAWTSKTSNKTGYNWKWNLSAVQHLWEERTQP